MPEEKVKVRKKKWYTVVAPANLGDFDLGEIPLYDLKSVVGRTLKINLMNITDDPKKQSVNVIFKVTDVKGDNAITEMIGYELIEATIHRLVGRAREKIEDSYLYNTSDNRSVRVKPLMVARKKISHSLATALRLSVRKCIAKDLAEKDYNSFVYDLISGKLQNKLMGDLKKIYPLKIFVIRAVQLEGVKKGKEVAVEEVKPEPEEDKKEEKPEEEIEPEPEEEKAEETEEDVEPEPEKKKAEEKAKTKSKQ